MSKSFAGPGVNVAIKQLTSYVQTVPSSIGMTCLFAPKGEDNVLKYFTSQEEFIKEFGEPNSSEYPLPYSLGKYIGYNFLEQSGAFYAMRCLSEDAQYALAILVYDDSTKELSFKYDNATNKKQLKQELELNGSEYPLCVIAAKGRGEYYNKYSFQITQSSNPVSRDVFILDIHERIEGFSGQARDQIVESFEISFKPDAKDMNGNSLYIVDVLENYSDIIRAYMTLNPTQGESDGDMSPAYDLIIRSYDRNIGTVSLDSGTYILTDDRQDFSEWTTGGYSIILMDGKGNSVYGYLNTSTESGSNDTQIKIYTDDTLGTAGVKNFDNPTDPVTFDFLSDEITYEIHKTPYNLSWAFSDLSGSYVNLKKGSEGSLVSGGVFQITEADLVLKNAFSGLLFDPNDFHNTGTPYVDSVKNTEFIYFTEIYDPGYSDDVKNEMVNLAKARENCILITDNGDNYSAETAKTNRANNHKWNDYHVCIFEGYSKIDDPFTNRTLWISPVYHMSSLIPQNDSLNEIWNAVAGVDFTIATIKELRYEPNRVDISDLYLKQLNPIVHFREGFMPWGNLTSQLRPGPMQDLNISRLVLWVSEALKRYARGYIFKSNDEETWSQVSLEIKDFLRTIQEDRGLYSFGVDVGASEYEIKTKKFHINVTLKPMRAVEQINLTFFVE